MNRGSLSRENKIVISLIILLFFICIMVGSYAIFVTTMEGKKLNQISTGTLTLELEEANQINLISAVPVSDEKGRLTDPYNFTLKNLGSVKVKYQITVINDDVGYEKDGCVNNKLSWGNIKYQLIKNGVSSDAKILTTDNGVIDVGDILPKTENKYSLRFWIDSDSTNEIMGRHFHGKIKIDAVIEE